MNTQHCFRSKKLIFSSLIIFSLFFAIGCQKPSPEPNTNAPLDYALQVIPDIHKVMPIDLVMAMDSMNALHFGDNPPKLYLDSVKGFRKKDTEIIYYLPSDTTIVFDVSVGDIKHYSDCFRFYDQHKGVADLDYRCEYTDNGPNDFMFEVSSATDSVFIMGENGFFTAYYKQIRHKKKSAMYSAVVDYGSHEAVILSGKVTSNGIQNLFYGIKILGYDDPSDAGDLCLNIGDIVIYYQNFSPFEEWDPEQYN